MSPVKLPAQWSYVIPASSRVHHPCGAVVFSIRIANDSIWLVEIPLQQGLRCNSQACHNDYSKRIITVSETWPASDRRTFLVQFRCVTLRRIYVFKVVLNTHTFSTWRCRAGLDRHIATRLHILCTPVANDEYQFKISDRGNRYKKSLPTRGELIRIRRWQKRAERNTAETHVLEWLGGRRWLLTPRWNFVETRRNTVGQTVDFWQVTKIINLDSVRVVTCKQLKPPDESSWS